MVDQFSQMKDYLYKTYEHNPFVHLLQIEVTDVEAGTATLTMPITEEKHTNLYNFGHGGALASLADTAMGAACLTTGKKVVTLDMNMNFLRTANPQKFVSACAKVVHNGNRTMVAETDIVDMEGHLLLKARATFFVIGPFLHE